MDAAKDLKTAKSLMVLGLAPFCLGAILVALMFASARKFGGGLSDVLLGLLVLTVSYAASILAAGGGAVWSMVLLHQHEELRSDSARILWKIILLLLTLPALWFIYFAQ